MKNRKLSLKIILLTILMIPTLLFLAACGDDSSPSTPASPISVDGYVSKAAVEAASVNLWSFSSSGDQNLLVAGPYTTDALGHWSGEVPAGTSGYLMVVASGGSYVDESTGSTVTMSSDLYGILDMSGIKSGNTTPMTHAMVLNAQERIAGGTAMATALGEVMTDIDAAFGFDLTSTAPIMTTAGRADGDEYAVFLAGISALLDGNAALTPEFDNADTWDLVMGIAQDLTDGILDGHDIGGGTVMVDPGGPVPATPIPFPPLDLDDISELIDAANAWALVNAPGVSLGYIDLADFGDIENETEPGPVTVSGSLTVSGPDAALFGNPFTPSSVILAQDRYVGGFVFMESQTVVLSITVNPLTLEPSIVNAQNMQNVWNATFSIPGLSVIDTGNGWTLDFSGVTLTSLFGEGTITLNGTLTVTPAE